MSTTAAAGSWHEDKGDLPAMTYDAGRRLFVSDLVLVEDWWGNITVARMTQQPGGLCDGEPPRWGTSDPEQRDVEMRRWAEVLR